MDTLTTTEAVAAGGILGGIIASVGLVALALYVLMIVAWWKIFTKAGEAGWKSLIPIYNAYIYCKITGVNFWIYIIGIPVVLGILEAIVFKDNTNLQGILSGIYALGIDIYLAIALGNAFKKSTLFKLGLIFFPNIFQLILAFGSSKYAGIKK